MVEQILGLAALIARPAEEEKPLLEAMCTAAAADLTRRLRDGVKPEDCRDSFPCAAALLAAGGLLACRSGGDVEQFSVGAVTVQNGGGSQGCEAAAAMRRQAAAMMAGFCGDDQFAFLGVRG